MSEEKLMKEILDLFNELNKNFGETKKAMKTFDNNLLKIANILKTFNRKLNVLSEKLDIIEEICRRSYQPIRET